MRTLRRVVALLCLLAAGTANATQTDGSVLRSVGALNRALAGNAGDEQPFDLTVSVCSLRFAPADPTLSVFDDTGAATMMFRPLLETNVAVRAGDRLHVCGRILRKPRNRRSYPQCDRFEFLGHGPAPSPRDITAADLASGLHDNRLVRLTGVLRDVFNDEIDPIFTFLTLSSDDRTSLVAIPAVGEDDVSALRRQIGNKAEAVGICTRSTMGGRQQIGRIVCLAGPEDLHLEKTEPADLFAAPELDRLEALSPAEIATCDRHRCRGQVLALWDNTEKALLRNPLGHVVRVEFATQPSPAVGACVEAVGFAESDMFSLGLTRAVWRPTTPWTKAPDSAIALNGESINATTGGRPHFDPLLQGQLVRLEGRVSSVSSDGRHLVRIYLQDGATLIPVDVSNVRPSPESLLDCRIAVTGICVLDVDNWRPNTAFPQIREIFVVARTADDIRILATAPWWTPGRFVAVLGILLVSLVGFALWNRQLKRAVETKGRELEHEIIERIGSDFKVAERTRLAVELHDSLSQTLTGVAMKINAANRALPANGEVARAHLDLAARTLASCRGELKNCLWDLRNNALEDADMAAAVRRIVTPHIGDAALSVRFAALRDRFTESTAHALLRIIRELATNAVRHGRASHVQIAGVVENQKLMISVRDNGCGFDVATAPGMELGHFGLEGIRERLREFDGTLDIESSHENGTRAVVTFTLPPEDIT